MRTTLSLDREKNNVVLKTIIFIATSYEAVFIIFREPAKLYSNGSKTVQNSNGKSLFLQINGDNN